jgi:hypothetical protein
MVTGRANAMAAVLRGELVVDGSVDLLLMVQRLFGVPRTEARARATSGGRDG